MKPIKVVCGLIWKDNKIFIARRKPEKSLAGFWEFPGGKIEMNELPELALTRELKEELSMVVEKLKYFGTNIYQYKTFKIELIAYDCFFKEGTFQLTDHDLYQFVSVNELNDYKFAPADIYFVEQLLNSIR
jgi:8-oxo-dGTP diphosphatase